MTRAILILAALALAACAEPQPAAAPSASLVTVASEGDGVLRARGPTKSEDDLAAHHCAAAKRAIGNGAATMEWVGGVAKRDGDGYSADLVYETARAASAQIGGSGRPEDGGPVPAENWLKFCDEAGVPREGEA